MMGNVVVYIYNIFTDSETHMQGYVLPRASVLVTFRRSHI